MKKLLLAFALLGLANCTQPTTSLEIRIQKTIKDHIVKDINDPKSYESIDFKIYTEKDSTIFDEDVLRSYYSKKYVAERDSLAKVGDNQGAADALKKLSLLDKQIDAERARFTSKEISHFYVIHNFRAKNVYNALIKHSFMYEIYPKEILGKDFYDFKADYNHLEVISEDEINEDWISSMRRRRELGIISDNLYNWIMNTINE